MTVEGGRQNDVTGRLPPFKKRQSQIKNLTVAYIRVISIIGNARYTETAP